MFLVTAACFKLWLVREGNCRGHNCTGFHPPLQGYLCCKLWPDSFHFTLATKGVAVDLGSGGILQWRQDNELHRSGIATAVPREDLLGCMAELAVGSWADRKLQLVPGHDHVLGIRSGSAKRGETILWKTLNSTFKSWLAKQSNCPGNSTGFQMHLSMHDLQRGSLAQL